MFKIKHVYTSSCLYWSLEEDWHIIFKWRKMKWKYLDSLWIAVAHCGTGPSDPRIGLGSIVFVIELHSLSSEPAVSEPLQNSFHTWSNEVDACCRPLTSTFADTGRIKLCYCTGIAFPLLLISSFSLRSPGRRRPTHQDATAHMTQRCGQGKTVYINLLWFCYDQIKQWHDK